ncbi:hypothetical protein [Streptococcus sciuri]|uniref:Uncharacterized protein n=1 Tax=Streptococcus sciuri TaxID=2973939 RepID=A0ABT2F983_9STRE|nr:hypothetical protein [Streptococcus sciuri]MCS4488773.1 hypothetical protein [Streptococcus sciuri]
MKKIMKCMTLLLLAVVLSGSVLPSVKVLADSSSDVIYQAPKESDYQYLREERSIWTKVGKAAIRTAIKNRVAVVNAVKSVFGKTIANQVDRYFTTIASSLSPLLSWSEIPAQAVHDVVYRGLVNSGVSSSTATQIAHAIKEVLSWVL